MQVHTYDSTIEQYRWVATAIKRLIEADGLQHFDFLIILPDVRTNRSAGGRRLP